MAACELCWRMISVVFLFLVFSIQPAGAQSLSFDPDPFTPQDYIFTVPLVLESGGLSVKGVEAIVSFDTALVTLESITPGPWYTASGQDFFFWDYTTPTSDTIHFASAMLDGSRNADDIIAYCHFSFVDFGFCVLDFDLVDVRGVQNQDLGFASDDGLIILGTAVGVEPIHFSTLKAIYR